MAYNYIKRPDAQFNVQQALIVNSATSHAEEWNIPQAMIDELLPLQESWQTCYATAIDPNTATKMATTAKNLARKAYETALRQFVMAEINYNPKVTDIDRDSMELPHHDKSHHPSPVPTTMPVAEVDTSVFRQITIAFRDSGSESKAKPAGVHGVEILWAVTDTPAPSDVELTNSAFDTRSPYTFTFTNAQRGKTLCFALRWENTRGEKGPLSLMQSAIIP